MERRKLKTDKNKKYITYEVGDLVLLKAHPQSSTNKNEIKKKLFLIFNGPFKLKKKKLGLNTCIIKNNQTGKKSVQNVRNLRPYFYTLKENNGDTKPTGEDDTRFGSDDRRILWVVAKRGRADPHGLDE